MKRVPHLLLASLVLLAAASPAAASCRHIQGLFVAQAGGLASAEATSAFRIARASTDSTLVRLRWEGPTTLKVAWGLRQGPPLSDTDQVRLYEGTNFQCEEGTLVFPNAFDGYRQAEGESLYGKSRLIVRNDPKVGLILASEFFGRRQVSLFSYDSANLSIPIPGSGQRVVHQARWPRHDKLPLPPVSSAHTATVTVTPAVVTDSPRITTAQSAINPFLSGVQRGWVQEDPKGVRMTFTAREKEAAETFLAKLTQEGLAHEIIQEPIWSDRGYYFSLVLLTPSDR